MGCDLAVEGFVVVELWFLPALFIKVAQLLGSQAFEKVAVLWQVFQEFSSQFFRVRRIWHFGLDGFVILVCTIGLLFFHFSDFLTQLSPGHRDFRSDLPLLLRQNTSLLFLLQGQVRLHDGFFIEVYWLYLMMWWIFLVYGIESWNRRSLSNLHHIVHILLGVFFHVNFHYQVFDFLVTEGPETRLQIRILFRKLYLQLFNWQIHPILISSPPRIPPPSFW